MELELARVLNQALVRVTGKQSLKSGYSFNLQLFKRSLFLILQGFRQLCKLAVVFLKAPDMIFFGVTRCLVSAEGASYPGGVWRYAPGKFLK